MARERMRERMSVPSEVERLRKHRVRPERDLSLRALLASQVQAVKKLQRAVGGCAAAWEEVVPEDLRGRTALVGVSRGVLTVKVEDAGTKFELDRFLRSGGEAALVGRVPVGLRRVKLVL